MIERQDDATGYLLVGAYGSIRIEYQYAPLWRFPAQRWSTPFTVRWTRPDGRKFRKHFADPGDAHKHARRMSSSGNTVVGVSRLMRLRGEVGHG